jgi:hypothetical protein
MLFPPAVFLLIVAFPWIQPQPTPLRSGPQPGSEIGPYSFLIATGPKRGTQHCYVCENRDKPVVLIFARDRSEELGRFLTSLDRLIEQEKATGIAGWVTFLAENQPALEPDLVNWGRKHGLRHIPLGIFEDKVGPPRYRLHAQADLTILLVSNGKVKQNFTFKSGSFNDAKAKEILQAVPSLYR